MRTADLLATLEHHQQDDARLRRRLAMQGFHDIPDEDLRGVALGLRFAPAVCLVGAAAGTALASPGIIAVLLVLAAAGAVSPHAVPDLLYNRLVARPTGRRPLPPRGAPSRFACQVATLWLAAILGAFLAGLTTLGYALGTAMTVVAATMTFGHYCVASHLYRLVMGWPERPP